MIVPNQRNFCWNLATWFAEAPRPWPVGGDALFLPGQGLHSLKSSVVRVQLILVIRGRTIWHRTIWHQEGKQTIWHQDKNLDILDLQQFLYCNWEALSFAPFNCRYFRHAPVSRIRTFWHQHSKTGEFGTQTIWHQQYKTDNLAPQFFLVIFIKISPKRCWSCFICQTILGIKGIKKSFLSPLTMT